MENQAKNNSGSNFFSDNRWLILLAIFIFLIYLLLPILTPFLIAAILVLDLNLLYFILFLHLFSAGLDLFFVKQYFKLNQFILQFVQI
jgi:hypothetical protein